MVKEEFRRVLWLPSYRLPQFQANIRDFGFQLHTALADRHPLHPPVIPCRCLPCRYAAGLIRDKRELMRAVKRSGGPLNRPHCLEKPTVLFLMKRYGLPDTVLVTMNDRYPGPAPGFLFEEAVTARLTGSIE